MSKLTPVGKLPDPAWVMFAEKMVCDLLPEKYQLRGNGTELSDEMLGVDQLTAGTHLLLQVRL